MIGLMANNSFVRQYPDGTHVYHLSLLEALLAFRDSPDAAGVNGVIHPRAADQIIAVLINPLRQTVDVIGVETLHGIAAAVERLTEHDIKEIRRHRRPWYERVMQRGAQFMDPEIDQWIDLYPRSSLKGWARFKQYARLSARIVLDIDFKVIPRLLGSDYLRGGD